MQDVLQVLRRDAPGIRVVARSVEMKFEAELLATSAINLVVGYYPEVEKGLGATTLYHGISVCL